MELIGKGTTRKGVIQMDGFVAARDRIEALLSALRCWDEHSMPPSYTLYCIADLIGELLPSESDCELLDRYYNSLPDGEE